MLWPMYFLLNHDIKIAHKLDILATGLPTGFMGPGANEECGVIKITDIILACRLLACELSYCIDK